MNPNELDNIINDPKTWCVTEFNNPNTQLHAAAPELLQALERAVALIAWELKHDVTNEWPNVSGVKLDIEKAAIAAINKATGGKQ
jgi:hypothetical protein